MKIFISYAKERDDVAQAIALKLKGAGFRTFLDTDDLPAGASFDARLRAAIERCDFFLFLVSPESVTAGSYALTELEFAKQRWPHPDERVLPVIAVETPFSDIPRYLREVTLLAPAGDVPAETLAAVVRLQLLRRIRRRRHVAIVALAVTVVALAVTLVVSRLMPSGEVYGVLRFEDLAARKAERGFAAEGDVYQITVRIHNDGETAVLLDTIDAEAEHARLTLTQHPSVYYPETVPLAPGEWKDWGFQVRIYDSAQERHIRDEELVDLVQWRLTWLEHDKKRVTEWRPWQTGGQFNPAIAVPIDRAVRHRVTHVVARQTTGFLAAVTDPPGVVALSDEGAVVGKELGLAGEITDLSSSSDTLLATTVAPTAAVVIDTTTLAIAATLPFAAEHITTTRDTSELSFVPYSIARAGRTIWLATGDSATGEAAVYYRRPDDEKWTLPTYVDGFELRPYTLRLYTSGDLVLGVEAQLQPTSIFAFQEDSLREFGGHDHESIAVCHDLVVMESGAIRLFTHDNELVELAIGAAGFARVAGWRTSMQEMHSRDSWQDHLLARSGDNVAAALSATLLEGDTPIRLQVSTYSKLGEERELLDTRNLIASSIAATAHAVMVVTRDVEGRRLTYVIADPYP